MKRRDFLALTIASGSSFLHSSLNREREKTKCKWSPSSPGAKPNIVLILADDLGYSDIGCFGGEIETPNIDRLATNGLRFTHFYNAARCCPSRASLLTGLYPHQTGVGDMMRDHGLPGYHGDLNQSCVTIAEVLRTVGYRCYMAGKWHVTRFLPPKGSSHNWPIQRGFERCYAMITGAGSYFWPDTLVQDNIPIEVPAGSFYFTEVIAEKTVSFIREHRKKMPDVPFFIYCSFTAPHWPLHALKEDIERFQGKFNRGWDLLRQERYHRMIAMGLIDKRWELTPRQAMVAPWNKAEHKDWQLRRIEVYAAQVYAMDRGIGKILSELKGQGVLDSTFIIFLSDNGACHEELTPSWGNYFFQGSERVVRLKTRDGRPVQFFNDPEIMPGPEDTYQSYGLAWANLSSTPYRGFKCDAYEGGIATPLIIHWPSQIKRGISHQLGHIIDIMPTLIEVSGAKYPAEFNGQKILGLEGVSLFSATRGQNIKRDALFFEHEGNRAVITPQWKLIASGTKGSWELYDREADRTEIKDLAVKYPVVVNDLAKTWETWAQRTNVLPWPWK